MNDLINDLTYFQVKVQCRFPADWIIHVNKEDESDQNSYKFTIRHKSGDTTRDMVNFGSFICEDLLEGIKKSQIFIFCVEKEVPDSILCGLKNGGVHTCWTSSIPGYPFIKRSLILDTRTCWDLAVFRYEYSISGIDSDTEDTSVLFKNNAGIIGVYDCNEMSISGLKSAITTILDSVENEISEKDSVNNN